MKTCPEPGRRAIAVLGAGSMGTALAHLAAGNGHPVRVWSIETDVLEEVRDHRRNTKYLPGLDLDSLLEPFWELADALAGADIAVLSVPSHVVRTVAREAAPHLRSTPAVLNVAKGLEEGTDLRMSQVLAEEIGGAPGRIASMGGPAVAAELARGTPTAVIVAAERSGPAAAVQAALQN
ncbi:MAG: NAD(P)-binding domain-containing protein, partial [Chloroflexi bacterium]|nr:NAD(P)-binding domain-containing protein [Chloroflexota bacterium]